MVCPKCRSNKLSYNETTKEGYKLIATEQYEAEKLIFTKCYLVEYTCSMCECNFFINEKDEE